MYMHAWLLANNDIATREQASGRTHVYVWAKYANAHELQRVSASVAARVRWVPSDMYL